MRPAVSGEVVRISAHGGTGARHAGVVGVVVSGEACRMGKERRGVALALHRACCHRIGDRRGGSPAGAAGR